MTSEFTASKQIGDLVEFDKEHKLWRLCSDKDKVYEYGIVKKVNIIEEEQKGKRAANTLNNMAGNLGVTASFVQPSTYVKVQLKVHTNYGEVITFDVSKDYLMTGTLDYHADKRRAQEVKKGLKVLEKRNRES